MSLGISNIMFLIPFFEFISIGRNITPMVQPIPQNSFYANRGAIVFIGQNGWQVILFCIIIN